MAKKVLVVDDDKLNIVLMERRLTEKGYEVVLARDGDVALDKVEKEHPDLMILDIEMPRVNGYLVLSELAKMPAAPQLPVIALTAHEELRPIFEHKGVRGYLIKPVNFATLFLKMEEIFCGPADMAK
ncbi:MAG: response regulator [Candidatus Omnitrophica bacterium]|nr:response regulator [Candidatus Omnitrophota bacterium]